MSKWVGYAVSVRCGSPLGCYQGTIAAADGASVTLTKAFRNGFPYPKAQVTLNVADIKSLSIIEAAPDSGDGGTDAYTSGRYKKSQAGGGGGSKEFRTGGSSNQSGVGGSGGSGKESQLTCAAGVLVSRNSRHNKLLSDGRGEGRADPPAAAGPGGGLSRRTRAPHHKTTVCESLQATHSHTQDNALVGGPGPGPWARDGEGSSVRSKKPLRGRDALAFGGGSPLDAEFDFQSNLLLFDKRAVGAALAARPDVVPAPPRDYRHDQNVLGEPPKQHLIQVPLGLSGGWYATDAGLRVPALLSAARQRLWAALQQCGLEEAALVLLARAAADLALKLLGGARRLEPRNAHQQPAVTVLAGHHRAGRTALQTARLLSAAGVSVVCCVPPTTGAGPADGAPSPLARELEAVALHAVPVLPSTRQLPNNADTVIAGIAAEGELLSWARGARCAVLAIEPPSAGEVGDLVPRAAVSALLPLWPPPACQRLHLVDVAVPSALYQSLGVRYSSPFGAATTLALHPTDD